MISATIFMVLSCVEISASRVHSVHTMTQFAAIEWVPTSQSQHLSDTSLITSPSQWPPEALYLITASYSSSLQGQRLQLLIWFFSKGRDSPLTGEWQVLRHFYYFSVSQHRYGGHYLFSVAVMYTFAASQKGSYQLRLGWSTCAPDWAWVVC